VICKESVPFRAAVCITVLRGAVAYIWIQTAFYYFTFDARFSSRAGTNLRKSHGVQQFLLILRAPHQVVIKPDQRCGHVIWCLIGLWVAWCRQQDSPTFYVAFYSHGRTVVTRTSLFGIVERHSGFPELHSCVLWREALRHNLFAKFLSQLLATWDQGCLQHTLEIRA